MILRLADDFCFVMENKIETKLNFHTWHKDYVSEKYAENSKIFIVCLIPGNYSQRICDLIQRRMNIHKYENIIKNVTFRTKKYFHEIKTKCFYNMSDA